ncbi:MAG: geranyl transferase [Methylococcales bacterium]|jgi:geranylgeranyl pyrophosphate synthase|nr:geranyl transferase [Methylococcales bacterium]MBT7445942.1 geranyl transferase [Methylococcales bacterium]
MNDAFSAFSKTHITRLELALKHALPAADAAPTHLHQAMRYSTLAGGKRIRPLLTYASGALFNLPPATLDTIACAVECIHGYSLIHDDLPAMDDDDLRRGQPTCHKQFDEATAILAGDALQALAFTLLSQAPHINAEQKIALIERLSIASGSLGMAGGQAIDLNATGKTLTLAELENMHSHKTGAIIRAAVTMPADCGNLTNPETQQHLDHFAKSLGLAFQIHDDILDIESPTNVLGKTSQKDIAQNKATYPSLLGLEKSKEKRAHLLQQGLLCLKKIDADTHYLEAIAEYIIKRIR